MPVLLHRRWYYDPKTEWYYGGEPVSWTQKPGLASASMFGAAPHEGGPVPQPSAAAGGVGGSSKSAAAGGASRAQEAAAAAAAATGQKVVVRKTVMQLPSHPQSAIGGHQMPTSGRIGGAKGVGADGAADDAAAAAKVRFQWLMLVVGLMSRQYYCIMQLQQLELSTVMTCFLGSTPGPVMQHTLMVCATTACYRISLLQYCAEAVRTTNLPCPVLCMLSIRLCCHVAQLHVLCASC
jgi:hypothetical protein